MYLVTEKYKYLEALSIVNDNFYSDAVKEKYKLFIKNYLKNKKK
jgi:hypothetical protein